MRSFFSNPLIPVQGAGWTEPVLAAQEHKAGATLARTHFHHRLRHTQTRTHSDCAHLWDVGKNESQREPMQTLGEYADSTQTVALSGISWSHQPYNKMSLNKVALFEDPAIWVLAYSISSCLVQGWGSFAWQVNIEMPQRGTNSGPQTKCAI